MSARSIESWPGIESRGDQLCSSAFGIGTSAPDAVHLACAAAARVDLFLTDDTKLTKLHVPGIRFIAGLDTSVL